MIEADGHLALGELELKFATELIGWLCKQHIFGTITQRAALMAIMPPPTAAKLADGRSRPGAAMLAKPATGGPRR